MNTLVFDTECSGALRNNAHPFDRRNRLVAIGCYSPSIPVDLRYYTSDVMVSDEIRSCPINHIGQSSLIVGFNLKFDLHWIRRYGINLLNHKLWDCQLAEFIIDNQRNRYPSLNDTLQKYGLPVKKDILKSHLDRGIDVDAIPKDELLEYLGQDLESTYLLYEKQKELIKPYYNLFRIQCQDLAVLADMEWNGLKFNTEISSAKANWYRSRIATIKQAIQQDYVLPEWFNFGSGDHLSAFLYGGTITTEQREQVGVYKTGSKIGQPRFKVTDVPYTFPRLVSPPKGSELKKDGLYSTAEDVLKELKGPPRVKRLINNLLDIAKLEKEVSTYFEGIPSKFPELGWDDGIIHGQLNQCVARTGRTSSSNPNLQNASEAVKECFESRWIK